jgi:hypothetical protein
VSGGRAALRCVITARAQYDEDRQQEGTQLRGPCAARPGGGCLHVSILAPKSEQASYDRRMNQIRVIAASVALAVPAAVFALNAFISYRERGFIELLDVPAALAFAILSILVARGYRLALYAAVALVAVYLVTALTGGVLAFIAYWVATLVLVLLAVPIIRHARAHTAVQ